MRPRPNLLRLLRTTYRLTEWRGGQPHHSHYPGGRHYRAMLRHRTAALRADSGKHWALYKTGPLGLPERMVDNSQWHNRKGGRP